MFSGVPALVETYSAEDEKARLAQIRERFESVGQRLETGSATPESSE